MIHWLPTHYFCALHNKKLPTDFFEYITDHIKSLTLSQSTVVVTAVSVMCYCGSHAMQPLSTSRYSLYIVHIACNH